MKTINGCGNLVECFFFGENHNQPKGKYPLYIMENVFHYGILILKDTLVIISPHNIENINEFVINLKNKLKSEKISVENANILTLIENKKYKNGIDFDFLVLGLNILDLLFEFETLSLEDILNISKSKEITVKYRSEITLKCKKKILFSIFWFFF